jgi:hypothetical protein
MDCLLSKMSAFISTELTRSDGTDNTVEERLAMYLERTGLDDIYIMKQHRRNKRLRTFYQKWLRVFASFLNGKTNGGRTIKVSFDYPETVEQRKTA